MYRKILVPTDGTERSLDAIRQAVDLAKSLGAALLVLHVRSPINTMHHVEGGVLSRLQRTEVLAEIEAEERAILESAGKLAADAGVEHEVAFVRGYSVYETILRVAREENCDLIVMSSHGRRGLAGLLLGSETQKLLTHSDKPVLIVR
ncbi:MAG TPA: universal stress protein [Burkholderiales bacterium]|nr:universal stress protein [Burkholderiales bacterium]